MRVGLENGGEWDAASKDHRQSLLEREERLRRRGVTLMGTIDNLFVDVATFCDGAGAKFRQDQDQDEES